MYDTRVAGRLMLRALMEAHKTIVEGLTRETIFMAGTTTILGNAQRVIRNLQQ